jgi:hypothetical protein
MVRTELAAPARGVTEPTENEQFNVMGHPLTDSAIGLVNDPDCVVAVILNVFDCPARMVSDEGEALKDRVEGCTAAIQEEENLIAPEIWLTIPGFPAACTKSV